MPATLEIKTLSPELVKDFEPGTWIAVSHDQERIVGSGRTIDEALRKAKENKEDQPFVIRVPLEGSALIL